MTLDAPRDPFRCTFLTLLVSFPIDIQSLVQQFLELLKLVEMLFMSQLVVRVQMFFEKLMMFLRQSSSVQQIFERQELTDILKDLWFIE